MHRTAPVHRPARRLRAACHLLLTLLALSLGGCNVGSDDSPPPPPTKCQVTLGAEGGTVQGLNGVGILSLGLRYSRASTTNHYRG